VKWVGTRREDQPLGVGPHETPITSQPLIHTAHNPISNVRIAAAQITQAPTTASESFLDSRRAAPNAPARSCHF
jgi:hypothetical protein